MTPRSVLFLTPDLLESPGGIARHALTVCSALVESGTAATAVVLHDPVASGGRSAASFPSLHYVPCGGSRLAFIRQTIAAARAKPAIVLIGHPNFAALGFLAARISGARLIVFGHGIDVWEPLGALRRRALQRADRVICVSQFTADRAIASNALRPDRMSVLYHCLPPDFAARAASECGATELSLLTVARLRSSERYKGHTEVIRALPNLLRLFPGLKYDIVGDGDGRSELEDLAADQGVSHAVRFHGEVSEAELALQYAKAAIFVMPSRGEGFGLTFLEAMAYGKPVVAGNVDATPEVVRHGETGLLVDPADSAALTAALERLLADVDLRRRLGRRGAEVVASDFSYGAYRGRLLACLESVVSRREAVPVVPG